MEFRARINLYKLAVSITDGHRLYLLVHSGLVNQNRPPISDRAIHLTPEVLLNHGCIVGSVKHTLSLLLLTQVLLQLIAQ